MSLAIDYQHPTSLQEYTHQDNDKVCRNTMRLRDLSVQELARIET